MGIVGQLYYRLSQYVNPRERQVGIFFAQLTERSAVNVARSRVLELMQQDIAVINMWTEYKYKGYTYLRKSTRRKLYANLDRIAQDFDNYYKQHRQVHDGVVVPQELLLRSLTEYFSPHRGVYQYRESSSFSRLLRDPTSEKLVGDCNQIVTLYVYLYSRYFDIRELKIRLLPSHVALHYEGIDIEATNGTFTNYDHAKGATLMPIEELVSVNLLDTTDLYLATHEIAPEDFLQSSRFAYMLSHDREIVTRNLDTAYAALVKGLTERHNYTGALKFAKQSGDVELLAIVGNNGAVYYMGRQEFSTARRFAHHALRRQELIADSYRAEGIYYYGQKKFRDAIKAFQECGDQDNVRKCYAGLFFTEQDTLPRNLTSESIRHYSKAIHRMRIYAKKSGNKELISHVASLEKYL